MTDHLQRFFLQALMPVSFIVLAMFFYATASLAQFQGEQTALPELKSGGVPCRQVAAGTVVFNLKSHKYHDPRCRFAIICTANCVNMPLAEVQSRGGIPCAYCGGGASTLNQPRNQINPRSPPAATTRMVTYNRNSHKYHNPSCPAAVRCTSSCEDIPYSEAIARGAIPCQLCGGGF